MTKRADIVTSAREWVGTPFHHQARLKGVGADCIGLLIGVARERAIVAADYDIEGYGRAPDGKTLDAQAGQLMTRADPPLLAGQIVLVDFGAFPQHFGIVGDWRHGHLSIIHAVPKRGVIEIRLMFTKLMRFVAAFDFPGVTE